MAYKESQTKIALITGANKGIGFETARQLGALGYTILVGARDKSRGEMAVRQLIDEGMDAHYFELDVTNTSTIIRTALEIETLYGKLDVLVNNAGVILDNAASTQLDISRLRDTFETNVFGAFAVTIAMLPLIRKSSSGRIVNLSSSLGSLALSVDPSFEFADFKVVAYNASKTALNALTIHWAHELQNTAIKVNSADPGYSATDMNDHLAERSPALGAAVVVKLATLPDDGATGGFFNEQGVVPW